jgi:hypothetical protein
MHAVVVKNSKQNLQDSIVLVLSKIENHVVYFLVPPFLAKFYEASF